MPRTADTSGFSIPPALLQEAARIAEAEGRTGGALFRDMLRNYKSRRKEQEPYGEAWALNLMREAQEEERLHPMTPDEEAREEKEMNRYAAAQSKKVGIKEKDIPKLIKESRVKRRAHASRP